MQEREEKEKLNSEKEKSQRGNFKSPSLRRVFTPVKKLLKIPKSKNENVEILQLKDQLKNLNEKLKKYERDSISEDDENMPLSELNILNGSPATARSLLNRQRPKSFQAQKLKFELENNEPSPMKDELAQPLKTIEVEKMEKMEVESESIQAAITIQNVLAPPPPPLPVFENLSSSIPPPPPLLSLPSLPQYELVVKKKESIEIKKPEEQKRNSQFDLQLELQERINLRKKALEDREKARRSLPSTEAASQIVSSTVSQNKENNAPVSQLETLLRERRMVQQKRIQSHIESSGHPSKRVRLNSDYHSNSPKPSPISSFSERLGSFASPTINAPPPPPIDGLNLFSPKQEKQLSIENTNKSEPIAINQNSESTTPRFSLQEIQNFDRSQLKKAVTNKDSPKPPSTPDSFSLKYALLQKFQSMALSPDSEVDSDSDGDDF